MIVYREQRRKIDSARALAAVREFENIRDLLIDFGELECGVADAVAEDDARVADLRAIALNIGRVFYRWSRRLPFETAAIERDLAKLADLPASIEVSVPEGYSYYGLFPETYVDAAEKFFREAQPARAVCIGIRSIGTSLSAVVAGTLAELGCEVETWTVRPRGHPLDRVTDLPPIRDRGGPFLIVDEGPGLSGSSFGSVAEALTKLGVAGSRIVFFPSWIADAGKLVSQKGREHWRRHRAFTGEFDPALVLPDLRNWLDVSAGGWRKLLFANERDFPAVQPQHERRKFVSPDRSAIAKFAGFGLRGKMALARSEALHDAGFVPRPREFSNGFLFSSFAPGKPVAAMSAELLRLIAGYLAHIRRDFLSGDAVPSDTLRHMIAINTSVEWAASPELCDAPACVLDGRMLPHEWIETAGGYLKTDAADHGDDHFFPGPQDVVWDLAAVAVEFSLGDPAVLAEEYERRSGDRGARRRLPFYLLAYSAFRLGYCRLALNSVQGDEWNRFKQAEARYRAMVNRYSAAVPAPLAV